MIKVPSSTKQGKWKREMLSSLPTFKVRDQSVQNQLCVTQGQAVLSKQTSAWLHSLPDFVPFFTITRSADISKSSQVKVCVCGCVCVWLCVCLRVARDNSLHSKRSFFAFFYVFVKSPRTGSTCLPTRRPSPTFIECNTSKSC